MEVEEEGAGAKNRSPPSNMTQDSFLSATDNSAAAEEEEETAAVEGGTARGSGHVGPAGTLVTHLGCAAVELAIRVASRYVASRDVGPGLVAGSGLEETFTLGFYYWRGGTLNTRDTSVPGYTDWLLS